MFGRESAKCPNCQGDNIRASKWNSRGEKARNPGMRPLRCSDCSTRFMVAVGDDSDKVRFLLGAGLVLVVLLFMFADWPERRPGPPEGVQASVSLAISAAAMKAAEDGDQDAQFSVATSILADPELNVAYSAKALEFLRRAAEKGHTRAMLRLGQIYRKGVGALQNYSLAAKWIEAAAKLGEPEAMLEFGRLYREGIGVPRDLVRAYIWMNRAAAARNLDAAREREEVSRILTAAELAQAQEESVPAEPTTSPTLDLKPAAEIAPH